jgi:hypothetical protein
MLGRHNERHLAPWQISQGGAGSCCRLKGELVRHSRLSDRLKPSNSNVTHREPAVAPTTMELVEEQSIFINGSIALYTPFVASLTVF